MPRRIRLRPHARRWVGAFTALLAFFLLVLNAQAESLLDQWREGLRGVRLTAYSGRVIGSNSTLTVIRLCRNGRFVYTREGSWSADGAAMGASQSRLTGTWRVERRGGRIVVVSRADSGESGAFPVYLQNDGKVNLGGLAYSAERGRAGC